ncbi:fluoride efflux transporter CrcB [Reichenbachiella ulvae]|uniref:Fluoride-specific ion channel FluC n=1 Tax=Reichenbachiella ulvae TaxID=2980104 RepID=A0ABT3CSP2_9BACT|nr:fluoride efflux transporter CrcB [Reichenbachiella ulvae]MCV9386720.1 fluoride efflux transporter CrcB [Reichenbachiella ulvae]
MIKAALFVGMGGFLGSVGRYLISHWVLKYFPGFTPSGTLAVNILGCFILGFLMHTTSKLEKEYFLLLTTGFCGGFTTFSTFGVENLRLVMDHQHGTALAYMGGSLIFGLLAAGIGYYLGKTLIA